MDLEHELEVLTARQNTLLDQALANMDDLTITEQLKTLLEEKQHLQARIDAVKTEAANRISEVERITVVNEKSIRIKFRYSNVEIEQTVC